jgi:K+-sensing histidine kinase KdpD
LVESATRHHERRAVLRRTEDAVLRRILNATADGIVVVDRDGAVCFANPAAAELFGRPAGELVRGIFGFPLVAGTTTEVDVVGSQGGPTVVEMRTAEMEWQGEPAYLASLRDITDRRRAEEERAQRVQAEAERAQAEAAVRSRDAFLAMAAHELKTPLTRLRLGVQGAMRRPRPAGTSASVSDPTTLQFLDREVAHLSRLVRQLFDLARIESGDFSLRLSSRDLRPLVERAVESARDTAEGHTLTVRVPAEPVSARVDPEALLEALIDLLTGAVRHSRSGTTIATELEVDEASARLVIRDDGPPVPAEVQLGLSAPQFPPHTAAYIAGPGVPIHVARRVVELHAGRLDVEFPERGGTRVLLRLPLESEKFVPKASRPRRQGTRPA